MKKFLNTQYALLGGAVDPFWADVSFLSGFEGTDGSTTFVDEKGGLTVTAVGNAQIDTAQFKYGVSSLLCDGTGDAVTIADNAVFEFGSGSWTIEGFVRFGALGTFGPVLFSKGNVTNGSRGLVIDYKGTGNNEFRIVISGDGTASTSIVFADTLTTNVWYHVCFEYDAASTTLRTYRDGVMRGAKSVASRTIFNNTQPFYCGGNSANLTFNGWLDEVRVTKGVARYNSDSGFVVPTEAYPRS